MGVSAAAFGVSKHCAVDRDAATVTVNDSFCQHVYTQCPVQSQSLPWCAAAGLREHIAQCWSRCVRRAHWFSSWDTCADEPQRCVTAAASKPGKVSPVGREALCVTATRAAACAMGCCPDIRAAAAAQQARHLQQPSKTAVQSNSAVTVVPGSTRSRVRLRQCKCERCGTVCGGILSCPAFALCR